MKVIFLLLLFYLFLQHLQIEDTSKVANPDIFQKSAYNMQAIGHSSQKKDPWLLKMKSKLYQGHKDLNDWIMIIGRLEKQKNVSQSMHSHL